jgi:hypothetical protein
MCFTIHTNLYRISVKRSGLVWTDAIISISILMDEGAALLGNINDFFEVGDFEIKNVSGQRDIHVQSNTLSLYLSILPGQYIYIHNIEKCSQLTGTEKLKKVIDFGKHIKVKYIRLYDGSCVASNTCLFIALASFEILTTGNSWYNKFGFRSPTSDLEKSYNTFIGEIPFITLIDFDIFLQNIHTYIFLSKKFKKYYYKEKNIFINQLKYIKNSVFLKSLSNSIKKGFEEHFNGDILNKSKSTKQVLSELKRVYLNKDSSINLNVAQCDIIEDLTLYLDGIICYDHNLQLELPSTFGGKSKTKNRMSRRPRKYSLQPMHSMKHKKGTRKSRK